MTDQWTETDVVTAALEYAAKGWSVFPVQGKRPAPGIASWPAESTTDPAQIVAWWAGSSGDLGIGLDLGKSGLCAIDGDHLEVMPAEVWEALQAVTRVAWTHQGQRDRMTWLLDRGGLEVPQAAHHWGDVKSGGGYIVVAPSPHPDQEEPYQWVHRPQERPGPIPRDLVALVAPRIGEEPPGTAWTGEALLPEHFEAARAHADDLARALAAAPPGGRNHELNRCALLLGHYVPHLLEAQEVTRLLAAAAKACGLPAGEAKATIRSGLAAGMKLPTAPPVLPDATALLEVPEEAPEDPWAYGGDLRTVEEEPDVPPDLLTRSDGLSLLYPNGVHNIVGESESGKSWLAIAAIVENTKRGQVSLYVDFEDHRRTFLARLLALGLTREEMGLIHYYAAERGWGHAPAVLLERHAPTLVVIDAVSEAMGSLNLDPLGTADAVGFVRWVRLWGAGGAAVVVIDHVVKDKNSQGRWSLGSQHKVSGVQAHYVVEPLGALMPGSRSSVLVKVGKNRAGHVRAGALPPEGTDRLQVVGVFHFGGPDGALEGWELVPMAVEVERGFAERVSETAERLVLELLRDRGSLSGRAVVAALGIEGAPPRSAIREALERLVVRGQVAREARGGKAGTLYTRVDLFAMHDDDLLEGLE